MREFMMNHENFAHQLFFASTWEAQVKEFIESLNCTDKNIWYKKPENKKTNEELITLGYYVKYRFGEDEKIGFRLNKMRAKLMDGFIKMEMRSNQSKFQ